MLKQVWSFSQQSVVILININILFSLKQKKKSSENITLASGLKTNHLKFELFEKAIIKHDGHFMNTRKIKKA